LGDGEKEVAVVATLSHWQLLREQEFDQTSPHTAVSIVGSNIVVVVFVLVWPAAPSSAVAVDPPRVGATRRWQGGEGRQSPPA